MEKNIYNKKEVKLRDDLCEIKKNSDCKNKIDIYYKQINSIIPHKKSISSLSIFPLGNIISVSFDKSIKIFDNNLNIIQTILNAHDNCIIYVCIKDENNFVTSSYKNIKTWIKNKGDDFSLNQTINNAHDDWINKIIYYLNENLISCSHDKKIKIWEKDNNKYQCITILTHNNWVYSILLLKDINILISSGLDRIKFWNLNNFENIINLKAICYNSNALKRIDKERIIIGGKYDGIIKIISIKEKKIVKEIKNKFKCFGICIFQEKGIFLIGGRSEEIKIYKIDNYECIKIIENAHNDIILGINKLKNHLIASYGEDRTIKIWSIQ